MAQITVTSRTETSLSMRVTGFTTDYSYTRQLTWYVNGEYKYSTVSPGSSMSPIVTFSGLRSGRTYYLYCYVYLPDTGNTITLESQADTLEPPEPSVAYWSWGTTDARRRAVEALYYKGLVTDFSYLVWNEMVDKVLEVANAKGYSWWIDPNSNLSYAATKMTSYDRTMTAARFNSLRYNVGAHYYQTEVPVVYPGGTVYGWYFTTLMDLVNEWIDS